MSDVLGSVKPAGHAATDGSTTIATGGTAQDLFSGATPSNGWIVSNPNASGIIWVSDTTTAAANATGSTPCYPGGSVMNPAGRIPAGAVSVVHADTGAKITASSW